jgi:hypothetical protein
MNIGAQAHPSTIGYHGPTTPPDSPTAMALTPVTFPSLINAFLVRDKLSPMSTHRCLRVLTFLHNPQWFPSPGGRIALMTFDPVPIFGSSELRAGMLSPKWINGVSYKNAKRHFRHDDW